MKMDTMLLVRWLFLLLAVIGWLHILMKHVHPGFAPGLLCGITGSMGFLSGLFGLLDIQVAGVWAGTLLFLAAGLCFLMLGAVRKESFRGFLCWPYLVLLILAGWFLYTLYGIRLTGYDDFTHWGIVARILVREGRFPLPTDRGLTFQAYSPGSAVIIYIFCRLTGLREEWAWLYAQALTTICMFLPLTVFGKGWKQKSALSVVLLILLSKNTFFINLLVDTLVSGCAIWCMCLCMYERENPVGKYPFLIPILTFFLTIKTSALFYFLVVILYAAYQIRIKQKAEQIDRKHSMQIWQMLAGGVIVSVLPLLLWRWYVRMHFPAGLSSKHAFSLEYFKTTMADKTWDGMKFILVRLLNAFFSPEWEAVYLLIFGSALAVFLWRGRKNGVAACTKVNCSDRTLLSEALVLILVSGAAYFTSLAISYIVSMPWVEASVLAGFERYLHTYTVFACGILSVALLQGLENEAGKTWWVSAWLLLLLLTPQRRYDFYLPWPMEDEPRTAFEKLTEGVAKPMEQDITLLFAEEPENWGYIRDYFSYMAEYVLEAPSVQALTAEQLENENKSADVEKSEDKFILLIPEDTYVKLK